jgi:small-conductance mechanosensitive channel
MLHCLVYLFAQIQPMRGLPNDLGLNAPITLGPLTTHRTLFELVSSVFVAVGTMALAFALLRLVPVLERFVILRARRNASMHDGENAADLSQRIETLTRVTGSVARTVIWSVTIIVVLGTLGLSVTPILAGAGIAGVAVGFGAQSIIRDFLAGFFILLEDQFGVGDTITIGAVTGLVERLTLRITVLRDLSGTAHFIPNSSITTVANRTLGWVRVMVDLSFSVTVPDESARAALSATAKRIDHLPALEGALLAPTEVEGPLDLAGGAVTYRLVGKAHADRTAQVRQQLIRGLRAELAGHQLVYSGSIIVAESPKPASAS